MGSPSWDREGTGRAGMAHGVQSPGEASLLSTVAAASFAFPLLVGDMPHHAKSSTAEQNSPDKSPAWPGRLLGDRSRRITNNEIKLVLPLLREKRALHFLAGEEASSKHT